MLQVHGEQFSGRKKKKDVKHVHKFNLHEMYCDRSCQEYHYFDS